MYWLLPSTCVVQHYDGGTVQSECVVVTVRSMWLDYDLIVVADCHGCPDVSLNASTCGGY